MKTKKFFKSEQAKIEFLWWLGLLEARLFKKATGRLQNGKGYCCLGVACVATIAPRDLCVLGYYDGESEPLLRYDYPEHQGKAPSWLKRIDNEFKRRTGCSLADRNDDYNWSHPRIAKALREVFAEDLNN